MSNVVILELRKIAARPRSYIGFIAITVIVLVIQVALFADGRNYINFITQNLDQTLMIEGHILNGHLVCFIILQTLIVQIPLLIALVTGDLISGEAATGTIRLLATKPVSRSSIFLSKFFAGSIYIIGMLMWLGILALGLGLWIFGKGDLIVLKSEEFIILPGDDTTWRFFAALALAFVALVVVGALSLMLSCFTDNSIGPIITTMAIIILFTVIGTMEVPVFNNIRPFLFTTHMLAWRNLFDNPVPMNEIMKSVWIMLLHIAVFISVALYWFNKKDILS